jgi:hypothetical protein
MDGLAEDLPVKNQRKPLRRLADGLAVVMHPGFLFFYAFLLLHPYRQLPNLAFVLSIIIGTTIVFPVILSLFFARGDLFMKDVRKRPLPLLITCAGFGLTAFLLPLDKFSPFYSRYLFSLIAGIFISFLLSFRYKISLHGGGLGSFVVAMGWGLFGGAETGMFSFLEASLLYGLIVLLSLIVCVQRVVSGSHHGTQVIAGFVSGALLTVGFVLWG